MFILVALITSSGKLFHWPITLLPKLYLWRAAGVFSHLKMGCNVSAILKTAFHNVDLKSTNPCFTVLILRKQKSLRKSPEFAHGLGYTRAMNPASRCRSVKLTSHREAASADFYTHYTSVMISVTNIDIVKRGLNRVDIWRTSIYRSIWVWWPI